MVLGTSSHVGKSTLVTALCRIFSDDGFRVAPFKAQNLSLNSAATIDGGEIGRAQMLQAQAARVIATVQMNPILLKPQSDRPMQVVVLGQPTPADETAQPHGRLEALWPVVAESLDALRAEYDVVVAEGAGSPAEINLRARDIANMRVARHGRASVLLVGDIERGGVFASLVGTLALLGARDRKLVRGTVVNKLRGDPAFFHRGPGLLEKLTGVPTIGVLPYFSDIHLPAEDVLGLPASSAAHDEQPAVDVAVIRFPHIANFDDFDPLRRTAGVRVRFIAEPNDLGTPDLIVLPGTKSTVADLEWLRRSGLAAAVLRSQGGGTPILGICGGFQMIGQSIRDPAHVETTEVEVPALGILPLVTEFGEGKVVRQRSGVTVGNVGLLRGCAGLAVRGYEIHHGRSVHAAEDGAPAFELDGDSQTGTPACGADGMISADGSVVGTYMHGIFHDSALRSRLLANLADRRGITRPLGASDGDLDAELDRLAAHVRRHVDVDRIRKWVRASGS